MTKPRDKKDSEPTAKRKRPKLKKETLKDLAAPEEQAQKARGGRDVIRDCSGAISGCSL